MKRHHNGHEYGFAREAMEIMVRTSQRPGGDNVAFVQDIGQFAEDKGFTTRTVQDPEQVGKSILIVDVGDTSGEQALSAISHSDVVGVEGQEWVTDPWKLHEQSGLWIGRGVCDTHGSGVSMLLAARDPEVKNKLHENGKYISIIFTYDEEATSETDSMRGARLAAGLLGPAAVTKARYFIAGEPTEVAGRIVPMRAHKGRLLVNFVATVSDPGHVSDNVGNALMLASGLTMRIGQYGDVLSYGSTNDPDAAIYDPPRSTVQVTAGELKTGDFSTTPGRVRFTADMRTLPDVHDLRVRELIDLIRSFPTEDGQAIEVEILKAAPGSETSSTSPIVGIAERATSSKARGFNGGDEGRIMRLYAGKEGVTVGPGKLCFAHMPNEQIEIASIMNAAGVYSRMFRDIVSIE